MKVNLSKIISVVKGRNNLIMEIIMRGISFRIYLMEMEYIDGMMVLPMKVNLKKD